MESFGASSSPQKLFGNSPPPHPEVKERPLRTRIPDLSHPLNPDNLCEHTAFADQRIGSSRTLVPIRIFSHHDSCLGIVRGVPQDRARDSTHDAGGGDAAGFTAGRGYLLDSLSGTFPVGGFLAAASAARTRNFVLPD